MIEYICQKLILLQHYYEGTRKGKLPFASVSKEAREASCELSIVEMNINWETKLNVHHAGYSTSF